MASSQAQARRTFALAVVIGLHVLLIGGLVIGTTSTRLIDGSAFRLPRTDGRPAIGR